MSTIATQLNWGASYLVNDVYKRFVRKDATDKHYVQVGRAATVLLFLLSVVVTWQLDTIQGAWRFLIALGAGTGLVLILRWYWWRINAWSEISAMTASFVTSLIALNTIPQRFPQGDPRADSVILLVTVGVSTVVWVAVTFVTAPESAPVLERFYQRVRPGGPGWVAVSQRLGYGREPIPGGALQWTNWLAGVAAVYASLFGLGKLVFGDFTAAIVLFAIAAVAFAWIARSFREERPGPAAAAGRREALAAD
jgi:SSS family solute:Na+ symporter